MSDVVGYRLASQERRAAALKDRVQQLLAPFDGTERALDSGCGAGALAFALAPFVERVVGVDLSADLVAAGNELAPPNCELIVGDATALPFEYGSFDIAGCMRVLHHARRPELVVSELARVTRPGGTDPPRRPARVRRPGRLGRDRPLRAGARPLAHAAPARPGHPLPARRQRPRGADERDRARGARSRALPRSRRPRRGRAAARARDGARRGLRGRDRLVRRAQARRALARPSAQATRRPGSRSASAPGPSSAAARPAPSRRGRTGTTARSAPPCPRSTAESTFFATRSGPITNGRPSGVEKIFGCGNPGVVTNPGMIVCTSTPVPRSEARSERENATWAYFDAEYGAGGREHDRAGGRRDRRDVGAPARPRRLPEPVEQAAGHPDAAEVVDDERPLDLVERGVDEAAANEDAGAVHEQVDRRMPLEDAGRRRGNRLAVGDVADLDLGLTPELRRRGAGARPRGARRARSASPGGRAAGPSPARCPTRRR